VELYHFHFWLFIKGFNYYCDQEICIRTSSYCRLERGVTVAWNVELTNYYILSTFKKVSKFTRPTNMLNMTRIDLIISNIIKMKSVVQTRAFGLLLSAVMLSISTAMRLRYLLHAKAVLIANLLGYQVPFIIRKRNRAYDEASP
jgi:hypothetical protein